MGEREAIQLLDAAMIPAKKSRVGLKPLAEIVRHGIEASCNENRGGFLQMETSKTRQVTPSLMVSCPENLN